MNKPTRVKYKKSDTLYRATSSFLGSDGVMLTVTIDPTTNLVQVIKLGDSGEDLVEAVTEASFTKAKATAKALLSKYGVTFFSEVRAKKEKV